MNKPRKGLTKFLGDSDDDTEIGWSLIIEEDSPAFTVALNLFIDLIGKNLTKLNEIGISVDMITFWYLYEYEQQCNMEFGADIRSALENWEYCYA